jgi:hypothetical protein
MSQGSVVGILIKVWAAGSTAPLLVEATDFSPPQNVQTSSRALTASYPGAKVPSQG